MTTFTIKPPPSRPSSSAILCKYPPPLNLKSLSFSHLFAISKLRHGLLFEIPSISRIRTHANNITAKMAVREQSHCTIESRDSEKHRKVGDGFSSLNSPDVKVDKKYNRSTSSSSRNTRSSAVGEKRFTRGHNRRTNGGFYKREVGDGTSSLKSRGERVDKNSMKDWNGLPVDEKMEKYQRHYKGKEAGFSSSVRGDGGTNKKTNINKGSGSVVELKGAKRSRKHKVDSAEAKLKIGLEMCSKRGDVMGAISLYDSAVREGIKLGQYHYNVLLYLCSSAAVGVVHPAKSGRSSSTNGGGSRSFRTDLSIQFKNGHCIDLDKNVESGSEESGNKNLILQVSNGIGESSCWTSDKMGSDSQSPLVSPYLSEIGEKFNKMVLDSGGQRVDLGESGGDVNGANHDKGEENSENETNELANKDNYGIRVSEDVKTYALTRGFEIYEKMRLVNIPMSEAALTSVARLAVSMGNGDMAFQMVKHIKALGINPRLRSYGPALFTFCSNGDIKKAFEVEAHMLESGVYPEEAELEELLRLSVGVGRGDKVYYLLHKLRTTVRQVSPSTANLIERWFNSKAASRVGKKKWDGSLILQAIEGGGGGWHGLGWLGQGKWKISHTGVGDDGVCMSCKEKLTTIDLDPIETENFAKSVAEIAGKRERNSSFQKFQKWLEYYGPFEAIVDAANVGVFSQRQFLLSKVKAVVNGTRQKLPSKKWPLIVVHNRRISGEKMKEPVNKKLLEKWRNADALYATPTGSNDDWYWLYAAIKCKCLIVTNDEMRDHIFQILGNDFFPKWKERHQVHFSFCEGGPELHMPPSCSVVIQESVKGHWHIPIQREDSVRERKWICVTRARSDMDFQESSCIETEIAASDVQTTNQIKFSSSDRARGGKCCETNQLPPKKIYTHLKQVPISKVSASHILVSQIEAAEKDSGGVIDFQI